MVDELTLLTRSIQLALDFHPHAGSVNAAKSVSKCWLREGASETTAMSERKWGRLSHSG